MNKKASKKASLLLLCIVCGVLILFLAFGLQESADVSIILENNNDDVSATAILSYDESSVSINSYENETGDLYLFLPADTQGKRATIESNDLLQNSQKGTSISNGTSLLLSTGKTLTILTGSSIPSIYILLQNDLSYIQEDKTNSDSGTIEIIDSTGSYLYRGELEKIKGRGNTSWEADKKPYNITLGDSVCLMDDETPANRYSLLASSDITFLRNRISNELANVAGVVSLESFPVNVYINGSYEGVYELSRKVNTDNLGITDLEKENETLNESQTSLLQETTGITWDDWNHSETGKWWNYEREPEDLTGGYLLEADDTLRYGKEESGFILNSGAYIVSKSPKLLSEGEYQYISTYLQDCETVLSSSVGLDNYDALSSYLDIDSFVGKYLVEEISKNIDSSSSSQYLYKDIGSVLYAGPVWDYDWAYGCDRIQEGIDYSDPEGFSAKEITGDFNWWQYLYYNKAFYQDVVSKYEDTVYPWLNELVETTLTQWKEEMTNSAVMDYLRWDRDSDRTKAESHYEEEIEEVRQFLEERKEFLYDEWVVSD